MITRILLNYFEQIAGHYEEIAEVTLIGCENDDSECPLDRVLVIKGIFTKHAPVFFGTTPYGIKLTSIVKFSDPFEIYHVMVTRDMLSRNQFIVTKQQ